MCDKSSLRSVSETMNTGQQCHLFLKLLSRKEEGRREGAKIKWCQKEEKELSDAQIDKIRATEAIHHTKRPIK